MSALTTRLQSLKTHDNNHVSCFYSWEVFAHQTQLLQVHESVLLWSDKVKSSYLKASMSSSYCFLQASYSSCSSFCKIVNWWLRLELQDQRSLQVKELWNDWVHSPSAQLTFLSCDSPLYRVPAKVESSREDSPGFCFLSFSRSFEM